MKIKKVTKKFLSKLNNTRQTQKVEIGDFIIERIFNLTPSLLITFKKDTNIQYRAEYPISLDKIELRNLKK